MPRRRYFDPTKTYGPEKLALKKELKKELRKITSNKKRRKKQPRAYQQPVVGIK
jgi:hypothetical protein